MRLFETLLLVAALPFALIAMAAPGLVRGAGRYWMLPVLAALAAHFAAENIYWQVVPAYIACVTLGLVAFFGEDWRAASVRVAGAVSLFLLIASAASLSVVPKFRLPQPTGSYAIGTRTLHLTDPNRCDTAFKSGKRELMVQIWYPTDQRRGATAPYRTLKETTLLSSYDAVLRTHSFQNAPVARTGRPFPLILFNPAWNGQRTQNTFQMEYLAGHGFVVAAIDHTHNSSPVAFPDGHVVRSANTPSIDDFDGSTVERQIALGDAEVRLQADDDILVLDALTRMSGDPSNVWYRAIDTSRIGTLGHSFGGAVAIQTAYQDPRVVAAINLDGWLFGDIWQRPLLKPIMLMYEEDYPPTAAEIARTLASASRQDRLNMQLTVEDEKNAEHSLAAGGGYEVFLAGSKHMNFSDRSLYSPLRRFTNGGAIDAARAHQIINEYTLAFFSQTLRGTEEPLLQQTRTPFAEATLKIWPANGTSHQ